ncbi:MAG: hypothetical protein WC043_05755 [Pseudobdellovibrionaceae bacterium]
MTSKHVSSAKVIEGTLIISLPDALTPVVWQMELGQTKASALEVRNNDNGTSSLVLKTPRQDIEEVAIFNDRNVALKALMLISKAMEKSEGQLKSGNFGAFDKVTQAEKSSGFFKFLFKFVGIVMGIVVTVFILLTVVGFLLSGGKGGESASVADKNTPVSAEDFLEGR